MYIGIPRKETEKYNERQEKKWCCYGSNARQERLPRKNNRQSQGSKSAAALLNTPTLGHNRTWVLRKMAQKKKKKEKKKRLRENKIKCSMKENELDQDGMKGDGG